MPTNLSGGLRKLVMLKWHGKEVQTFISLTTRARMEAVTAVIAGKVIHNISKPVVRMSGPRGGMIIQRSKPGEFPRRDTGHLINSIEHGVFPLGPGIWEGYVASSADYATYLETFMGRPFLSRTLHENSGLIRLMLTKKIR